MSTKGKSHEERFKDFEAEMDHYANTFFNDPITKQLGLASLPSGATERIATKHGLKWCPIEGCLVDA